MHDSLSDDAFWMQIYPFEFADDMFMNGETEVEKAIALSGVTQGTALDLGCGPGRHSVPLAKRGFLVTAVDLSAFLLAKAADRAASAKLSIEFVRADMRFFDRPDAFDVAFSLFSSFGYFDDKHDDVKVLENVYRSIRPGAPFVMDALSKERVARSFQSTTSHKGPNQSLLVQRRQIVDGWTRIKNEWTIISDGRIRTFDFSLRLYSGQELRDALVAVGFRTIRLYGGLDGRPYGLQVERLIAVAIK